MLVQRLLSPSETFTVPFHNKQEGDKWAKHKYGCYRNHTEKRATGQNNRQWSPDGHKLDYSVCADVSPQERPLCVKDAQWGQAERSLFTTAGYIFSSISLHVSLSGHGQNTLVDQLKHQCEHKHAMWPWRFLLLVNIGCILGLASALIAISDDNVVHNKVVAEIWEHGDIFFFKQKHWFLYW